MSGKGIAHAKRAAQFFVEQLRPTDTVGIVTFADGARVLRPLGAVDNLTDMLTLIEELKANGGTDLHGGISLAYKEFEKVTGTRRVIVLTDGNPTVGNQKPNDILAVTKQAQVQQVVTSVFGMGTEFNEILMQQMAQNGDGNYYFIESPEQLSGIFEQEFKLASNVVGQNVVLDFSKTANVKINTVYNLFKLEGQRILELPNLQMDRSFDVLCKLDFEHQGKDSFGMVELVWFWEGETHRVPVEIVLPQVIVADWESQPVEPEVQTRKSLLTVASNQVKIAEAIQVGDYAVAEALFSSSEGLISNMDNPESRMLKRSLSVAKADLAEGSISKMSKGLRYASYSTSRSSAPDPQDEA
jgi:Ca-activated chloride channel family protein